MSPRFTLLSGVFSAALFASAPVLADDHSAETTAQLPSGPEDPELWKVSDEDTTIYLFGTVHVLPSDLIWYDAEIDEALSASDTIVTEIAMDPANEAKQQMLAQQKGVFTDGTTLRSLLDDEQKAAYENALASFGAPANAFDPLEPWLTTLTLTFIPLMQQGYDPNSGVEKVILSKAGEQSFGALETIEFQLDMFDTMPMDKQVSFMMEAVDALPEVKATLDGMVERWAVGDAEGLAELMNEDLTDAELAETLLYSRNANWAGWIEERMESTPGTVFMAVGAGHLAGEKSVQDYLEQRGIQSTRVQ